MADSKVPAIRPASPAAAKFIAEIGKNAKPAAPSLPLETAATAGAMFQPGIGAPTLGQLQQAQADMQPTPPAPGSPQQPAGPRAPGFSPQTLDALTAVAAESKAQREKEGTPEGEKEKEKTKTPYELEKEALESRLQPINVLDGIANNVFSQLVPIIPGKLEVRFQTLPVDHSHALWVLLSKRVDHDKHIQTIDQEMISLMQLTCMLVNLNSTVLPPYTIKKDGWDIFDEAAFDAKYRIVSGYPQPLVHILGRHAEWFVDRVQDAFKFESLKKS